MELTLDSAEDLSKECLSKEPNVGLSNDPRAGLSKEPKEGLSREPSGANLFRTGRGFFNPEPPKPIGARGALT